MRGDGQYARGFTILLYVLGTLLFLVTSVEWGPAGPPGVPRGAWIDDSAPVLRTLAVLILVVAGLRSWGLPSAWAATYLLCILLLLLPPIGLIISFSWFRSLRAVERPLTG